MVHLETALSRVPEPFYSEVDKIYVELIAPIGMKKEEGLEFVKKTLGENP